MSERQTVVDGVPLCPRCGCGVVDDWHESATGAVVHGECMDEAIREMRFQPAPAEWFGEFDRSRTEVGSWDDPDPETRFERDIVDVIAELEAEEDPDEITLRVRDQLANYSNRSGYDHCVNQDQCPHPWCDSTWHGLPIKQHMSVMRARGRVDDGYRYSDDDSVVICPGSAFEGEFEPPIRSRPGPGWRPIVAAEGWNRPYVHLYDSNGNQTWEGYWGAATAGWDMTVGEGASSGEGYTRGTSTRGDEADAQVLELPREVSFTVQVGEVNRELVALLFNEPRWWRCDHACSVDAQTAENPWIDRREERFEGGPARVPRDRLIVDGFEIPLGEAREESPYCLGQLPGGGCWVEAFTNSPPTDEWFLVERDAA